MLKLNNKSLSKIGDKNPMWKGDEVGYGKLHEWIRTRLIKPDLCPKCKLRKAYDLANKGIYNRDLNNWEWLCRRCHMESDGRLNVFLKSQRKFPKNNKYYKLRVDLKGEEQPNSKLTNEQVLKIRELYKTGEYLQNQLATMFNVCFGTISAVVLRKIWKHI